MKNEIWFKANGKDFRLPIVPPEFERNTSASYDNEKVLGLGEVAIYSANGLSQISFSSFFPSKVYPFCAYSDFPKPYDCVAILKEWKNKGTIVRVIITGTDINQLMRITNFNYGKKDASGDVEYAIDFIEHREIKIPKINEINTGNMSSGNNRPVEKPPSTQKTHKVVKGDNLWDIAHKYYGKGKDYPKIKDANKSKYPSLKNNNIIYVNWELIIP